MKYQKRNYICPMCFEEYIHGTNHIGEIYVTCKRCGNNVLYCNEDEARYSRESLPKIHGVNLTQYNYDIGNEVEYKVYIAMCVTLREAGYKKFAGSTRHNIVYWENVYKIPWVTVYQPEAFEGQFITDRGRLHAWFEEVYPNTDIRKGYFLEMKGEMKK